MSGEFQDGLVRTGRRLDAFVGSILGYDSRRAARAWATFGYHEHRSFTYTEALEPLENGAEPRWQWVLAWGLRFRKADCSGFCSGDFRHAGTLCPWGNWLEPGNTETYLEHGQRETEGRAIYGDVCVFGAELPVEDQHMAMVIGRIGGRVMVIGHGEQGCPCFGPADADPRSRTYLRIHTRTRVRPTFPPRA